MRYLSFAVLCVLPASFVMSQQVPNLINYQGKLTDANGVPLANGTYTLAFRIYDQAQGGTIKWGPQVFDGQAGAGHASQVQVADGFFNVMLGPIDTTSRSILSAFEGSERYLEITIANNPPLAPRQKILTAPYAVQAMRAPLPKIKVVVPSNYEWDASITVGQKQDIPGLKIQNFPVSAGSRLLVTFNGLVRITGNSGSLGIDYDLYLQVGAAENQFHVGGLVSYTSGAPDIWMPTTCTYIYGPYSQDTTVNVNTQIANANGALISRMRIYSVNSTLTVQEIPASQWVP